MPLVVRPQPLPPTSVTLATQIFASEVLVSLIRHFALQPGTQRAAAEALDIPRQLVSSSTRLLRQAGVLIEKSPHRGQRAATYCTDLGQVDLLLTALSDYTRGR